MRITYTSAYPINDGASDGELAEVDATAKIFTNPSKKATEDHNTGRYG